MNKILKLVLQGLVAVLPIGLTLYFIYWLLATVEQASKPVLLWLVPEVFYFPGLGIAACLITLFGVGLIVNAYVVRHLLIFSDSLLARIPLVKSLYGAIQDMMRVFSLKDKHDMKSVVSIDMGNNTHLIGFITGEEAGKKLFPAQEGDAKVGVYLPMSYQIGGFTVYVDRERLRPLEIGVEEAMRIALTGGVQGKK